MNHNVGSVDKVVRIIMGLALLSLIYFLDGNLRWIGLIGIVPLMTAMMGFCPLYTLFGIRTCPSKK
jgi:hypothetical protein